MINLNPFFQKSARGVQRKMRVMQPYEFERIRKILYKLKTIPRTPSATGNPTFLKRETWVPYEQGTYFGEKILLPIAR